MKTTEKDRLLKDVLNDESYASFRAGLFDGMLAELRRQRGARRRRSLLALAACVPIAFALYLLLLPRNPHHSQTTAIVHTVPLTADQIVRTAALNRSATLTQSRVLLVTTAATEIEILRSSSQSLERVSDQQLLALFGGQPVALVTVGPGERRLVLPHADEQAQ